MNPHLLPLAISYSDGEGEFAGVGISLLLPDGRCLGGYIRVPDELRRYWTQVRDLSDARDISQVEGVGPLLVLWNFGMHMKNHPWVHFIDNEGALAALAKGSSSVLSGEVIVGLTHELAAELGVIAWFDRVDTHSNPVDKLSRGKMDGPWKLQRIRFLPRLFTLIDEFCG